MSELNARFHGSVPAFYDRCLGPFLFEPYAEDLARRVTAAPDARVLEIACGTGIATRRLRAAMQPSAQLVATDLNAAMLEIARAKLPGTNVHWRTADAQALPFKDRAFDAVVCQFGYMFLPDRALGFAEARRVLRPGGTLITNVWRALADNPAAEIAYAELCRMFPDDAPQFLKTPYGSVDEPALRALAGSAGFTQVEVTRVDLPGRAPSALVVATGFAKGTPMSLELSARGVDLDALARAFEGPLLAHGGHPFVSPLSALVLVAS